MLRGIVAFVTLSVAGWQPALAAPHCQYNLTSAIPGQDTQGEITAPAGIACHIFFRSAKNRSEWSIVSMPSHGTLLAVGARGWDYVPTHGYAGPDAFTVEVSGEVMGRYVYSGSSKFLFAVNVVP